MATKYFCILANSRKEGERCIAGLECSSSNKILSPTKWIRPIGVSQDGELCFSERRYEDRTEPKVGDIVKINVKESKSTLSQPENWLNNERIRWEKLGEISKTDLRQFIEFPKDLWRENHVKSDRCRPDFIPTISNFQSLYLIKPNNPKLEVWEETSQYTGRPKKQQRIYFEYGGKQYNNISITDPKAGRKYYPAFPKLDEPALKIDLSNKEILICMSLALEFIGYHFKVAATIIEI